MVARRPTCGKRKAVISLDLVPVCTVVEYQVSKTSPVLVPLGTRTLYSTTPWFPAISWLPRFIQILLPSSFPVYPRTCSLGHIGLTLAGPLGLLTW